LVCSLLAGNGGVLLGISCFVFFCFAGPTFDVVFCLSSLGGIAGYIRLVSVFSRWDVWIIQMLPSSQLFFSTNRSSSLRFVLFFVSFPI